MIAALEILHFLQQFQVQVCSSFCTIIVKLSQSLTSNMINTREETSNILVFLIEINPVIGVHCTSNDKFTMALKILTHLNINTVDFRFEEMYSIHQLLIQSRLQSKRILFDVLNSKTLDNQ